MNLKKPKLFFLILALTVTFNQYVSAQDSTLTYSLQQARQYTLEHNKEIKNAQRSAKSSDLLVKQTIAGYLPHVSLSGSFTDNIDLMTSMLPGEMFGAPGESVAVQFGQKYNSDYGGTATQMIFNGSLIVGIQSAKIAKKLGDQNVVMQKRDVLKTLEETYFNVLTAEESVDILQENLENINKLYEQTKVSNTAGLIEDTQVDQLMVQKTSVKDALLSMERQLELGYNLLRFQMGIDAATDISLTDSLNGLISSFQLQQLIDNPFNLQGNIDYQLMETQAEISEALVKNEKATWLPTISAYYTYTKTGMGNELSEMDWFPMSVVGLQASFPIFGSGERIFAIKKAKVEYNIAKTNMELIADNLVIQEKQVRFNLRNAYDKYVNQLQNKEVAKRVLDHTSLKYLQGISSGTELIQANNDYLSSASSYISAITELLNAQTEYNSLFNNMTNNK